jgi:hypothetical protein
LCTACYREGRKRKKEKESKNMSSFEYQNEELKGDVFRVMYSFKGLLPHEVDLTHGVQNVEKSELL